MAAAAGDKSPIPTTKEGTLTSPVENELDKTTKEDGTLHTLEEAIIEKDLGVHVNYSLTFTYHRKQKIAAATKTVNYIRHTFQYMDKEIFLLLYKSLVRPLLEFASTIWNPAQKFNSNGLEVRAI